MQNKDGSYGRKYFTVVDRRNPAVEVVVRNTRKGQIDQSAVFYDAAVHKDHLTCKGCELPDVEVIPEGYQAGGRRLGEHFRLAHGQHHAQGCEFATKSVTSPHTLRNENKGPVIWLNGAARDLRLDFKTAFWTVPEAQRLSYRNAEGKLIISNPDLEDRPRRSAKSVEDMFRIMKSRTMTQALLNDSWILSGETATPWEKFFLRGSRLKDFAVEQLTPHESRHPVMLHVRMKESAKFEKVKGEARLKITLDDFVVADPETGADVTVHPYVYIRDKNVFPEFQRFKKGEVREFFVITTPYLSELPKREKGGPKRRFISDVEAARDTLPEPRHVYLHVDLKPGLYAWQSLAELSQSMLKRPAFTANDNPSPV